jgi:hypothetical protein
MADQDENPVEAAYQKERMLEQGTSNDDQSTPATGEPAARDKPQEDIQLKEHMLAYLAKHKKQGSSNQINVPLDSNVSNSNNVYETIHYLKKKTLDAPSLYGGSSSVSADIASFKLNGEAWGGSHFEKKVFGQKKIVSFSFNPQTLTCGMCADEHLILGSSTDTNPTPKVFIVADQGFRGGWCRLRGTLGNWRK